MVQIGCQQTMPVNLMHSHAQRRKLKTIAEQSAFLHALKGLVDVVAAGVGSIQEQMIIARPYLHIAGHRLAVEAQVVFVGTEDHVGQLVLALFAFLVFQDG